MEYIITIAAIILMIVWYLRRPSVRFWRQVSKYPNEWFDRFNEESCWKTFIDNDSPEAHSIRKDRDWDGPFRLYVPKINSWIYIYGRAPEYIEFQKQDLFTGDYIRKLSDR